MEFHVGHWTEARFGEDGKIDFNDKKLYDSINMEFGGNVASDLMGKLTLNFRSDVTIDLWGEGSEAPLAAGRHDFEVWHNGYSYRPRYNGDGFDLVGAEAALEGTEFSFEFPGASPLSVEGHFPDDIRSAEEQFEEGCVPYLELVTEEDDAGQKILTVVKWRFVDPDNTDAALTVDDAGEKYVLKLEVYPIGGSDSITQNIGKSFYYHDARLEGEETLGLYVPLADVNRIFLVFSDLYSGPDTSGAENLSMHYSCTFIVNDDEDEADGDIYFDVPDANEVEEANEALSENLSVIIPGSIEPVEQDSVNRLSTSTKLGFQDTDLVFERTVSAIAMKQEVDKGGAILLTDLEFPIRGSAFDGSPLPEPKIAANGLPENYTVYKSFAKGGTIDLVRKFGTDLFEYDKETESVVMKAALVVIDGPYKEDGKEEPGVEPAFRGDYGYGVKLSEGYLYVYDGIADGYASDPLWVGADGSGDPGGSGGYDAGLGAGAILLLAGLALFGMKKRG